MRIFAWCGISQSISASVFPALASVARAVSAKTPTASLNTACPSMCKNAEPSTAPPPTLPGTHKIPTCLPSACKSVAKMPGVSDASRTTAPAPSPNRTQVVRSLKSKILDLQPHRFIHGKDYLNKLNRIKGYKDVEIEGKRILAKFSLKIKTDKCKLVII